MDEFTQKCKALGFSDIQIEGIEQSCDIFAKNLQDLGIQISSVKFTLSDVGVLIHLFKCYDKIGLFDKDTYTKKEITENFIQLSNDVKELCRK
jgi:sugar phosphate isomerase/epimerase